MFPNEARNIDSPHEASIPRSRHSLGEARALCARLAAAHYENFPVASWLVPARLRPAVQAIYAFARVADDFADEPQHEGRRLQRLDEWDAMLEDCLRGEAIHPVFVALRDAIERHRLPAEPFRDLLRAFRQDVGKSRYADQAELLAYCRLSANPVGRLILHLFDCADPQRLAWSDDICTALQLTNHWQDVAVDAGRGRIYLPEDDRRRHGVVEDDLLAGRLSAGFRALMGEQTGRARQLFARGRPLCDSVSGRLRWELRLTVLGGLRVLERIEAVDGDVFARRPRLGVTDALRILGRAIAWA